MTQSDNSNSLVDLAIYMFTIGVTLAMARPPKTQPTQVNTMPTENGPTHIPQYIFQIAPGGGAWVVSCWRDGCWRGGVECASMEDAARIAVQWHITGEYPTNEAKR